MINLRLFFSYLILRTLIFSLPFFLHQTLTQDMIENIIWGQEWQIGYHKHPPFFAWFSEIIFISLQSNTVLYHIFSIFFISISIFITYKLHRKFLDEKTAITLAILLDGFVVYNFEMAGINANTILYFVFPLMTIFFFECLEEDKYKSWILFGILSGIAFLSKYYTLLFLFSVFLFALFYRRDLFLNPKAYVAFFIFLLITSPHIHWVLKNEQNGLIYFANKIIKINYNPFLINIKFFGTEILNSILFIFTLYYMFRKAEHTKSLNKNEILIYFISLVPFIFQIFYIFAIGKPMFLWFSASFFIIPLFLVLFFNLKLKEDKKFHCVILFLLLTNAILLFGRSLFISKYFNGYRYQERQVAMQGIQIWIDKYKKIPKYTSNLILSIYGREKYGKKIHALIQNDFVKSPWIEKDDLKKNGLIVLAECDFYEQKEIEKIFGKPQLVRFFERKDTILIEKRDCKKFTLYFYK